MSEYRDDAFEVARDLLDLTPANAVEAHLLEVLGNCVRAHEAALSASREVPSDG